MVLIKWAYSFSLDFESNKIHLGSKSNENLQNMPDKVKYYKKQDYISLPHIINYGSIKLSKR